MSLTLWEFFWDSTKWVAGPSPTPSPAPTPNRNAGAKGHDYHPLPDEYWETRKRYLQRFVEPLVKPILEESKEPEAAPPSLLHQKLSIAVGRAYTARNPIDLQKVSARINKLVLDIHKIRVQYRQQAAIILLLDAF